MATDPSLARTQRWMQAFILVEGTAEEAIAAPAVQEHIPVDEALGNVLPSATLTPLERVSIYRDMYLLRLGDALKIDYPGLYHFLGQEAFDHLVARYAAAHPSRSYTLNRLGDHLPDFIAALDHPKRDFLRDLARLELGLTEVFDAEQSPVLTKEAIAAVPPDAWETARLKPIAALRLMAFDYPVSAYLGAVDEENPFPRIRRKKTWVAGYRREFHTHRLDLSLPAFELLGALASGMPVGEAIVSVFADNRKRPVKQAHLFTWFRDWMSEGLFQSVTLNG